MGRVDTVAENVDEINAMKNLAALNLAVHESNAVGRKIRHFYLRHIWLGL